jgi:hypothetical protein
MRYLALLALAGCSGGNSTPTPTPPDADRVGDRAPVAVLAPSPNSYVDILFMIDDSTSTLEYQTDLKNSVPAFVDRLNARAGGLPNVHIGVVTSDLGTSAAGNSTPAPAIGTACAGTGENGILHAGPQVSGPYLVDTLNNDGVTRTQNFAGTITDAITSIVSVGAAGCGFEQHLEAVRRALDNNAANAGFLRDDASLAVILVGDEDDCSIADTAFFSPDTATLGALQSFRCTRFGITCDQGGATPDGMNEIGPKSGCHSNEQSQYLTHLADYKAFLDSLKPDPLMITVGAIVGAPEPVSVELRAPQGSTTPVPALAHSCQWVDPQNNPVFADPAVRDVEFANLFDRHAVGTICQNDLGGPLVDIARQIDSMTGSPCLFRDIAEPHDCVASNDAGTVEACTDESSTDCFVLVTDETTCPDGQHLRVDYRGTPAGKLTLSCKLP